MFLHRLCAVIRKSSLPLAGACLAGVLAACAGPQADQRLHDADGYRQVLDSPLRTDADRAIDGRRRPLEFLQFAGVRPGMQALDIDAGAGYTTQLLALAVGPGGRVWAQTDKPRPALDNRLAQHPQPNIVHVVRPFDDPLPPQTPPLDLITLILNYHDIAYMPVDRARMNRRLFDALQPGGHLVIVDHAARPGSGLADIKTLHRIDEAVVMSEQQQAGFRLEKTSDFLRNPADARVKPSSDPTLMSDRFALLLVKP